MPPLTGTTSRTSTSTSGTTPTTGHGGTSGATVAGIDISDVLKDLQPDHVAGVKSQVDLTALASVAGDARTQGLELWVVSIGSDIADDDTSTVADRLFSQTGGTLLVLSPTIISSRSDQLTDDQRSQATKAAAKGDSDLDAVTRYVDAALQDAGITTSARVSASTLQGVDIDGVVDALTDDHIAVERGVTATDATELADPVQRARSGGLELSVVVLKDDVEGHLSDVAVAVRKRVTGTVIVISPSVYAIASDTASDAEMDAALDSAADAGSYVELVDDMVDSLLG